jgi:hypothetical protein
LADIALPVHDLPVQISRLDDVIVDNAYCACAISMHDRIFTLVGAENTRATNQLCSKGMGRIAKRIKTSGLNYTDTCSWLWAKSTSPPISILNGGQRT